MDVFHDIQPNADQGQGIRLKKSDHITDPLPTLPALPPVTPTGMNHVCKSHLNIEVTGVVVLLQSLEATFGK